MCMINKFNEDIFFYIVKYLNINDIYNLRLSYKNYINGYFSMIVLLHERNYLEHLYDDYDTEDFYDTDNDSIDN